MMLYNSNIKVGGQFLGESIANNESLTYLYAFQSNAQPTL